MTLLIASVQARTPNELRARAERALAEGADAVELRLDGIDPVDNTVVRWIRTLPAGRWIATCRPVAEGGRSRRQTAERVATLLAVGAGSGGYIDFEFSEWARSAHVREKIRKAASQRARGEPQLILSHHDLAGRPQNPKELLATIAGEPGVIPKLAWMPESICDCFEALELARASPVPAIVICMGEAGLLSRVLTKKVGGFGTYCAADPGEETAPGQVTPAEMRERYRWASIGADTQVFGVIGWPVAHSLSPLIHNAAFEQAGIDAVYLPLAIDLREGIVEEFLDGCLARDWLGASGFSITVPHKSRVLRYLGDRADALSQRIGAVNTLVVSDGTWRGLNTDYLGALSALTAGLRCEPGDLRGTVVDVLGAGGVARAVVAGLRDHGCDVTIYNRTAERAARLAREFGCRHGSWGERLRATGTVLVNCTRVGMWPAVSESPYPTEAVGRYSLVFDTVYNPVETRLLRHAAAAGCRTIGGVEMFVNQAAAQFEAWTGRRPDTATMRRQALRQLARGVFSVAQGRHRQNKGPSTAPGNKRDFGENGS